MNMKYFCSKHYVFNFSDNKKKLKKYKFSKTDIQYRWENFFKQNKEHIT